MEKEDDETLKARGLKPDIEDDEEEDDDFDEDEEDEEEEEEKAGRKRAKMNSLFLDEAESESEDEEALERAKKSGALDDDLTELQRRHLDQRRYHEKKFADMAPEDIAKKLDEKYNITNYTARAAPPGVGASGETARATGLPTTEDPKLFVVKCKPGKERNFVVAVMNRFIANTKRRPAPVSDEAVLYNRYVTSSTKSALGPNGEFLIFSALATGTKGYIYVEAMREDHVKAAIYGIDGLFATNISILPLEQMPEILKVELRKESIRKDQFVRLTRFPYKGDLAKVAQVTDAGARVWVRVVPRLDLVKLNLSQEQRKTHEAKKLLPVAKLFNPMEVTKAGGKCTRDTFRLTGEEVDKFDDKYFQDGFLYMEISIKQVKDNKVFPTLDEQRVFAVLNQISTGADFGEMSFLDSVPLGSTTTTTTSTTAINGGAPLARMEFLVNDRVMVIQGEQRGAFGNVISVDDRTQIAVIELSEAHIRVDMRFADLQKTFNIGAHVKILSGPNAGVTGTLVKLNPGVNPTAIVYSDEGGREVQAFVSSLRSTSETASGLDSLAGYRLHDLVQVGSQMGCVIRVGTETLRVLTQLDEVQEVAPTAIRGKKNEQNKNLSAMDRLNQSVRANDTVQIVNGVQTGLEGVVKHIHRSVLFVHCRMRVQNSGIILVKASDVKLAGDRKLGNFGGGGGGGQGKLTSRKGDDLLDKTVRVRSGQFKGFIGLVVQADDEKATIEFTSRARSEKIKRMDLEIVGDRNGPLEDSSRVRYAPVTSTSASTQGILSTSHRVPSPPGTPGARTPGAQTPGPYTPGGFLESATPGAMATPGMTVGGTGFKKDDKVRLIGTNKTGVVRGVTGMEVIVGYTVEGQSKPVYKIERAANLVRAE